MSIRHTALICACLGLPPPVVAQLPLPPPASPMASEAPWDPSPVPFSLSGELFQPDASQAVTRKLILLQGSGFAVRAGQTLDLRGPICPDGPLSTDPAQCQDPDAPPAPALLLKLGDGHLRLSGANAWQGNTVLLQGSLGLETGRSLGHEANALDMAPGARVELADGLDIRHSLQVLPFADLAAQIPPDWGIDPEASTDPAAVLRVARGAATWRGRITSLAPIAKTGAGTLRLLGSNFAAGHPLVLREGGLQIGDERLPASSFWFGAIHAQPGTTLSGTGLILDAQVAGRLQPGAPAATGTLLFGDHLHLADSARTRIRIDGSGRADQLWSLGSARLGGALWIDPSQGRWTPGQRWTIIQADGGLDYAAVAASDPAAAGPVGQSTGNGRFHQVGSTLRYLDPVVSYGPTTVTLGLRYNDRGLNTADAGWRGALLNDSRFLRESALMHGGSGQPWVQTWAANSERGGHAGLPGDDRDTGGGQMGISRPIGKAWHLSAFAGVQDSSQGTASRGEPVYRVRDSAAHLGLGAEVQGRRLILSMGIAQSRHRARIHRRADASEPYLDSRAQAVLNQAWVDIRPSAPADQGRWALIPWARTAWLHVHRAAVQESEGLAAVRLPAVSDSRWLTQLGLRAGRHWPGTHGDAQLQVQASLRSLWGGDALSSPQAYLAEPAVTRHAPGLPMARHALQLDAGVQAPLSPRARLTLAYTGQVGGGQLQHGAWLGLRAALEGKLNPVD